MPKEDEIISFQCLKCERFCACRASHAGRIARCVNCNFRMIVPAGNDEPAKPANEAAEPPLDGFFQTALKKNAPAFFHHDSLPYLFFILFLASLAFFLGHTDLSIALPGFTLLMPTGWIILIFSTLFLFWYALRIVSDASLGLEDLPDFECSSVFDFFWSLLRDSYYFIVAGLLSFLPFSILAAVLEYAGMTWSGLRWVLLVPSSLLFPSILLLMANAADLTCLFRYDLIFKLIRRHFKAYFFTAVVSSAGLAGIWYYLYLVWVPETTGFPFLLIPYLLKLALLLLFLFAVRTVGIFGHHYMRTLPELWPAD